MSFKTKLSLAALCLMASGVAAAATSVGTGTVAITGSIGTATCTVTPSTNAITVPQFNPTTLATTAVNTELNRQTINFDFKDCQGAGNTMSMKFERSDEAPGSTPSQLFAGGFKYTGGTSTDSAKGPLYYRMIAGTSNLPLDPSVGITDGNNQHDISKVTDKGAFTIPVDFTMFKAAFNGTNPSAYTGTYSGSVSWTIEYP